MKNLTFFKPLSINTWLTSLTVVPSFLIAILLAAYFTATRIQDMDLALLKRGEAIMQQLAPASEYGVFSGNEESLQNITSALIKQQDIRSAHISNQDQLSVHSGPAPYRHDDKAFAEDQVSYVYSQEGDSLLFKAPILQQRVAVSDFEEPDLQATEPQHQVLGWVLVELSLDANKARAKQILIRSLLMALMILFVSFLIARHLGRVLCAPISQITSVVQQLESGQLNARAPTNAKWELHSLAKGINSMASALDAHKRDMEQQIQKATLELKQTLEAVGIQNVELKTAKAKAMEASKVKSEFLANMSHEIRTPMNGVMGFTHLLRKSKLNPDQLDYVNTLEKSASDLLVIIDDILDFSKLEVNKLELCLVDFTIRACIEDALQLHAPKAHNKGLELVALVYSDVPDKLHGDPVRIRQILNNLVGNAIKFTDTGDVQVRVHLLEEYEDEVELRIDITDTGPGISDAEQAKLFNAFTQADTSAARKHGGTGLGLVISQKLAKKMAGTVNIESVPGQGATFWFSCRLKKQETWGEPPSPPVAVGWQALLYDPHPVARIATRHALQTLGFGLKEVSTPTALLTTLQGNLPPQTLIVLGLDCATRKARGYRSWLSACQRHPESPCLVLASGLDDRLKSDLAARGADAWLLKPTRLPEFSRRIEVLLQAGAKTKVIPQQPSPKLCQTQAEHYPQAIALVVEDNAVNTKLITLLLNEYEITVEHAEDGHIAVEMCRANHYDIVLMDIQMPMMGGEEATRIIREEESEGSRLPIIALTAEALSGLAHFKKAGMDGLLTKPIDGEQLRATLALWLQKPPKNETPPPQAVTEKTLDWPSIDPEEALRQANNNSQLVEKLYLLLLKDLPTSQADLEQAWLAKDGEKIKYTAHSLRGAGTCCGAIGLCATTTALEKALQNKQSDWEQYYPPVLQEIERLLEETMT